jgi:hypothetical protein
MKKVKEIQVLGKNGEFLWSYEVGSEYNIAVLDNIQDGTLAEVAAVLECASLCAKSYLNPDDEPCAQL